MGRSAVWTNRRLGRMECLIRGNSRRFVRADRAGGLGVVSRENAFSLTRSMQFPNLQGGEEEKQLRNRLRLGPSIYNTLLRGNIQDEL